MTKRRSITSLPPSPDDDRRDRMVRYTIAMSVRFACFIACIFTPGWWILIPAIGAVVLPYIAVVIANVSTKGAGAVQQPTLGPVVPYRPTTSPNPPPEDRSS